ncbi:MAG: hypothetical protein U9O66_01605 [Patescibacteria group bacterium]|nr:hypothetical protein [Patescibacteria group bacterium]
MTLEQLVKKTDLNHFHPHSNDEKKNKKIMLELSDIEKKIQGIILGLFGSIMASFGIALGISMLTSNHWTILSSGLIVGLASSFANSFGPLVVKSKTKTYSQDDLFESTGSFIFTFIIIVLPLVSYLFMNDLNIARIISIMTGIVLLFIFGIHRALLEGKTYSPLFYASIVALIGAFFAIMCYASAIYFIK